jgi:Glycosyl transferase family 11
MIVVRLRGHLGNEMFQYAAGRSLAERHGTELVLDTSGILQAGGPNLVERNELEFFGLPDRVCPVWEVARVPNPSRLVSALQRLRPSSRRFVRVLVEDFSTNAFLPAVLTASDQTYLIGYWQFETYFADHEAVIRRAFTFPRMGDESERIAAEIRREPAVSIHVRRGDYVQHEQLGFLDVAYYTRAFERVTAAIGEARPYVFSDDPGWCREHLGFLDRATIVDRPLPLERAWEDMCLMSLCNHHVISNSTFGWWGAWLNPSPSKVVVAPKRWVLSPKRIGDPVPSRWLRV